ncbi:putative ABC transport system ATP-binding protein [Actinocorallia herbida]|uniref:Putative ABC transport system ATP-binding protein n=1 Tax=Actinocorallia herbida TaxID=58109 RepID=A0A3N1CXU0_9ACTN|nr:ABC transporter ATP-binding protein [Actinocorallia herbida]ROO86091.1 putative ABC transport system ATP-binding protein [Actinocorallia herbida]
MSAEGALIRQVLTRRARSAAIGGVATIVHQTCEALVPVAIGLAIDTAVSGGDPERMLYAVIGVLVLFCFLATGGAVGYWTVDAASLREAHHLRVETVRRILGDARGDRSRRAGDILSAATSDATATGEVVRIVTWIVSAGAGLVVSAVVLLRIDLVLGLGLILVLPVLVLGLDRLAPWLESRVHGRQEAGGRAAAVAAELVRALRPLRGFGGVPEAIRRYRGENRASLAAARDAASAHAVVVGSGLLATGIVLVGAAGIGVAFAASGRISLGELVVVVAMASFLADPVRGVSEAIKQLAVSRASARRLAALWAEFDVPSARPGEAAQGRLSLRGVVAAPVHGLDLEVGPGELIGVAAATPETAAALVGLLDGTRSPESGSVTWGGTPLAELGPDERRLVLHVEPHAVHLLGGTLGEALDTALEPASAARKIAALTTAGAADILTATGLDAPLQDHGTNLSGGQRQRLALARALLAAPAVLVLHDPLTAVDAVTEDLVAEALRELHSGAARASVVVTASPPLLSRCDRVVFLDADGRARTGTHAALLTRPDYAKVVIR